MSPSGSLRLLYHLRLAVPHLDPRHFRGDTGLGKDANRGATEVTWNQRYREKPKEPTLCECDDAEMAHWSPDGHCVASGCGCLAYKSKRSRTKYNAARTAIKGQHFDSKFEGKVGTDLKYRQMCGEKFTVRRQVEFVFVVNGVKISTYEADFVLDHEDGRVEVVEAKGIEMPTWRMKRNLMQALYPDVKLTVEKERGRWRRR